MNKLPYDKKEIILDILCEAFDSNISVNYIVKQDHKRKKRIRQLMDYSFELCSRYGHIYLSEDENACALTMLPHLKNPNLRMMMLDLKLLFQVIGVTGLFKVMKRKTIIKNAYTDKAFCYVWFVGVRTSYQQKGAGSKLLNEILAWSRKENLPVCLETSMKENIPFYTKLNFKVYKEQMHPHPLFWIRYNE